MLAWTVTKTNGNNNNSIPKTLLNVSSKFCEGYGQGLVATVITSPHTHLVGQEVRIDLRSQHFNQYAQKINAKRK